ncbi:MAG: hypothetical protein FWB85_07010 [Chitinispirillia bacterium]|nr:hypothetical protein [Chitinispirillia bacterium]MCL2241984.1 hypothetical protein [Chitinispirillia bacterium]
MKNSNVYLLRSKNADTVYERDWSAGTAGAAGSRVVIRARLLRIALCWFGILAAFALSFSMNDPGFWTEPPLHHHGLLGIVHLGTRFLAKALIALNLPPALIMIAGVSILAIALQYYSRCLRAFTGRYKIVIDDSGITDMTVFKRFIPWEEVKTIRLMTRTNTVLGHTATVNRVGVFVREPEKYLVNKETKRMSKLFGTPIIFGDVFLKGSTEERQRILLCEFYRRKHGIEAPPPSAGPRIITSGQIVSGAISRKNRCQAFRIELTQPGSLSIKVTSAKDNGLPNWESYVNITDSSGKKISSSGRFEFPYNRKVNIECAGAYDIEVKSSKAGEYHLTVRHDGGKE